VVQLRWGGQTAHIDAGVGKRRSRCLADDSDWAGGAHCLRLGEGLAASLTPQVGRGADSGFLCTGSYRRLLTGAWEMRSTVPAGARPPL
jgi:hypothetical protein